MAKKPKASETEAPKDAAPEAPNGPMLQVLAQYTKDLSFENPNAPDTLRADQQPPEVSINIEIARRLLSEDTAEVSILLRADAKRGDQTVFIAELDYAGLFAFQNMSQEDMQPLIMIECPRILFPFARQIMCEVTQNGGFPPILLDPPDFPAMYRDEMMRRAAQIETQGNA